MEPDLETLPPDVASFRMDACLKKVLGMPLAPEEQEVIADVRRRNGWDNDAKKA